MTNLDISINMELNMIFNKENVKEIPNLQVDKFNKQLKYLEKSKYYNSLIKKHNICSYKDFQNIPFLTKEILREKWQDIMIGPISDAVHYYQTTGTTGQVVPCPRNIDDITWNNATYTQTWGRLIKGLDAKVIGVLGPAELHSFADTITEVGKRINILSVKCWPFSPMVNGIDKTLNVVKNLDIDVIFCTPGLLMTLAMYIRKYKYDIKDFSNKIFLLQGELCTAAMKNNLKDIWNTDHIYDGTYSSQEAYGITSTCKNGHLHHISPNYIIEILDYKTNKIKPIEDGVTGELVVTMLNPSIKPMIRYCTGDLVRITLEKCDDIYSPIVIPLGRKKDIITFNGNDFFAGDIEEILLKNFKYVVSFNLEINNDSFSDFLNIKLELWDYNDRNKNESIIFECQKKLSELLGVQVSISVEKDLGLLGTTSAMVGWKAARISDNRIADDQETMIAKRISETKRL